jgi:hypothetical protein
VTRRLVYRTARECLRTLDTFLKTAQDPQFRQELVPEILKVTLLDGLIEAEPMMDTLVSRSSRRPYAELIRILGNIRWEQLKEANGTEDWPVRADPITFGELYSYVHHAYGMLGEATDAFHKDHLAVRKEGRTVVTARVPDEATVSPNPRDNNPVEFRHG